MRKGGRGRHEGGRRKEERLRGVQVTLVVRRDSTASHFSVMQNANRHT